MEAVCSLEDVARVLADSGYNLNDYSCFANAADLPSVLSALDSPDSFPESPCSDEDIARVLDIARIPSPSLLDSCTRGTHSFTPSNPNNHHHHHHQHHHNQHQHHFPSPTESFEAYDITIQKTRDPCITNVALQNTLRPTFHNHRNHNQSQNSTEPNSLDLFSIAMGCSSYNDDSVPGFCSLVSAKDINNNNNIVHNEDDAFNNYFNSSSALSPVSENGTILSMPTESSLSNSQIPPQYSTHQPDTGIEATISQLHLTSQINVKSTNVTVNIPSKTNKFDVNTTKTTKRKRRKKSSHMTPKPKRRKRDNNSQEAPKPKPTPKPKSTLKPKQNKNKNDTKGSEIQSSDNGDINNSDTFSKRKSSSNSNSVPRKSKKPRNNNLESTQECNNDVGAAEKSVTPTLVSIQSTETPRIEIGSTNGVDEEPKGPRRSSRSTRNTENYNFRLSSLVKRVETERKQKEPKQPKGKAKPPPLSKYRRRTANARERDRMKEINDAYDVLKNTLPNMEPEDGKNKITKFTILKLALNYISSLQDILGMGNDGPNSAISSENFSVSEQPCRIDDAGPCSSSLDNTVASLEDLGFENEIRETTEEYNARKSNISTNIKNDDSCNSSECN